MLIFAHHILCAGSNRTIDKFVVIRVSDNKMESKMRFLINSKRAVDYSLYNIACYIWRRIPAYYFFVLI